MTSTSNSKKSETSDLAATESEKVSLLKKLFDEFESAEKLAKQVEEFRDEAGLPAINELRYAGYHTVVFSSSEARGSDADLGQLISAINHCRRASYEAGEAGILAALTTISRFKDRYSRIAVSGVVNDWVHILERCDEISDIVAESRAKDDDRSVDHELYASSFQELRSFCRRLKVSADELDKKVEDKAQEYRRFILTTLIAVLGIIVALVLGLSPSIRGE